MLDFLTGKKKRKGKVVTKRTRAGRVRAKQAASRQAWQKQPKKQTSQPHGERQQKRAKIRMFCDRTKQRRRPKTSPPSWLAERLKLPRIMIYYAACLAFSAGAPLASPPSSRRATAAPARPAWAAPRQGGGGGVHISSKYAGCFGGKVSAHPPFLSFREWFTREQ